MLTFNRNVCISSREELDNLLNDYPNGESKIVVGENVFLFGAFKNLKRDFDLSKWKLTKNKLKIGVTLFAVHH